MGETYMNSMYMLEVLYSEAWDIADIEYELNGELSQATLETSQAGSGNEFIGGEVMKKMPKIVEFIGEILAWGGLFFICFMISVIGG